MTQYELDQINAERRRKGRPQLTMAQAISAQQENHNAGTDFLIGLTTGIYTPSAEGMLGAAIHNSSSSDWGSSSSCDTSSSYDSGSSSDSGSCGGGDSSF